MTEAVQEILSFWFGDLDEEGISKPEQHSLWFKSSEETDQHCIDEFGHYVESALRGELEDWAQSDQGLIALVLLLDQLTRNIYRGTPAAFSGDTRALKLAQTAIQNGRNLHLPPIHQQFLYLPLEHCEDRKVQEHCVALMNQLADHTEHEMFQGFARYALAHRDVIAQFGRFPHRNAILGRESTPEELAYLEKHGGF